MRRPLDDFGAMRLVAGIVEQAEQDYLNATADIARLKDKTDLKSVVKLRAAKHLKADAVRFMKSDYFTTLTGEDGKMMLRRLEGEV